MAVIPTYKGLLYQVFNACAARVFRRPYLIVPRFRAESTTVVGRADSRLLPAGEPRERLDCGRASRVCRWTYVIAESSLCSLFLFDCFELKQTMLRPAKIRALLLVKIRTLPMKAAGIVRLVFRVLLIGCD